MGRCPRSGRHLRAGLVPGRRRPRDVRRAASPRPRPLAGHRRPARLLGGHAPRRRRRLSRAPRALLGLGGQRRARGPRAGAARDDAPHAPRHGPAAATRPTAPLAPHFSARVIGRMEQQIRAICREILASAATSGEVDFVHEVAGPLPAQVIGGIMGLPEDDAARSSAGPRPRSRARTRRSGDDPGTASIEMAMYGIELAAARRAMGPDAPATTSPPSCSAPSSRAAGR